MGASGRRFRMGARSAFSTPSVSEVFLHPERDRRDSPRGVSATRFSAREARSSQGLRRAAGDEASTARLGGNLTSIVSNFPASDRHLGPARDLAAFIG